MIEITFRDFYDYKYREDEFHELYIMKNGLDEILYIGISGQIFGIAGLVGADISR